MPELTIRPGLTLHYIEINPHGRPAVLLLHGLGANGSSWQLQFAPLEQAGFRILAPDARGFGQSTFPGGSHTIADMAADMLALLAHLDISQAHLVGISLGGTLAQSMALTAPQKVSKLILVNTFAQLRPEKLGVWLYFALRLIMVHTLGLPVQARAVARRVFPKAEQEPLRRMLIEQICQADHQGYRATMRALARFNTRKRLPEILAPTLVISSRDDTTVPLRLQQQLAGLIPGARQVTIPEAGHAVTVERPEAFNQILMEFLT
jgi:pimeloyl-ACP methyl ester carboxylesterase